MWAKVAPGRAKGAGGGSNKTYVSKCNFTMGISISPEIHYSC